MQLIKKMFEREREREILHKYMEALANSYKEIEPDIMSSSICKIYDRLHGRIDEGRLRWLTSLVIVNLFVSLSILVVNLCRRKPG